MKSIAYFLVSALLFLSTALGALVEPHFKYSYKAQAQNTFNSELFALSGHFEKQNFSRLSAFPAGHINFLHADEVLTSTVDEGLIFINMSLVAPAALFFKVIKLSSTEGDFYLYHTPSTSIAFFNINEEKVNRLIIDLKKQTTVVNTFKNMFIDEASAADQIFCSLALNDKTFSSLEAISSSVERSILSKRIGECAVTALKGAGAQINETADFFAKLISEPAALWTDVKKSYDSLKVFVTNFSSELQSFYQTMGSLTLDEKVDIACTLTGQIGAGLALTVTGAGAITGGAKIMASIIPKLNRMKSLMLRFQRFKIPLESAKETLSCAI